MNKEEVLYQIVAVDSELKKGFPDEITTILKNGITGKTYTEYDFKNHRYLYCFINDNFNIYDRLEEKDKEIDRLNNIILKANMELYKILVIRDEKGNYRAVKNTRKQEVYKTICKLNEILETPARANYDLLKEGNKNE